MKIRRKSDTVGYADPLHAGRHPFQTFMLALCVVSGIPLLLGQHSAGSVNAVLPGWAATSWGVALAGGAALGLLGSYWPKNRYATALTIERVGLLVVGPAAVFYAVLIIIFAGVAGLTAALIVLAFGASALVRQHDIGKIFARAIATSTTGQTPGRVLREGERE